MSVRRILASILFSAVAIAAGGAEGVDQAGVRLEQLTAKLSPGLRIEFRMRAAQTLAQRHPELSKKFLDLVTQEISAGKDWHFGNAVLQGFAVAAPSQGIAMVPYMSPSMAPAFTAALARANHTTEALRLYRQSLAQGDLQSATANALLTRLVKENPAEATKLFRDMLAAAHLETGEPLETYRFLDCAYTVAAVDASLAAQACERVAAVASPPDYGADAKVALTATFQVGAATIKTDNSRDTLLVVAGSRLRDWAPARFEEHKALFDSWKLAGPLSVKGLSFRNAAAPSKKDVVDTSAIVNQMTHLRGLPSDADRARSVLAIVHDIRELPAANQRVSLASSLANLSTEGDLGKEALSAVADTIAQGLQDAPASTCDPYLELASLVRFEHLPAPKPDPALDAAGALITLQDQLHQEAGFTLTGLDGKTYSLAALRGHVVLLNFWATWCPPCRKEMPDMEKLYQRLQPKGLIVLAVSDEERGTVAGFEEKQKYTFPILLDPDRKVNESFNVEGIPKSFLFDREGKLVAQAIDMRTEGQFLEMLKSAGM